MRNPAPLVLTLALAVAALVLILRKPDEASPAAATSPPPAEQTPDPGAAAPEDSTQEALPPSPWPHEVSDIPADPAIVFGKLGNGMRYVILPNAEPPERVSVRLHIGAGSLMEADDQQGLAHFLEHMVFNGTEHFKAGELVPRMQRLGIAFGAHVNAFTSFDQTVYSLDLPDLSDSTLDLAFNVMRDFADGAQLATDEIDKERGVILAEMNSRDSIGYRILKKQFKALLPDSLIARRFPIGEEEIIRGAPRERFVDFYQNYYVPSRMTFVVVGAIDPAAMRKRIESAFGGMTGPEDPGADPQLGDYTPPATQEPLVFTDAELPATSLGLTCIKPYEDRIDNRENRADLMRLSLAHSMLGRRFDRIAEGAESPIVEGSASRQQLFRAVTVGSVDVTVTDGRLDEAVVVLENEFRRAKEHGFTEAELAEAKANILNYYQQQVANRDSRRSDELSSMIVTAINERDVLSSPETDLEVLQGFLGDITPKDCHSAFLDFWKDTHPRLVMTAKEAPADVAKTLSARFAEAAAMPVEPPVEMEVKAFAYTDFGTAGTVAEREDVKDLGVTRLTLSNGVTVNLKPTDYDKNRISLMARIGHGRLLMDKDKVGLAEFATAVVNEGGIGEHSAEELRRILAGRNVGTGFSVGDGHFSLAGTTTPDDLQLQLQLMAAQVLHPGTREEAISQFRRTVPMLFQQLKHNPDGAMQDMFAWLHGDDPRFEFPDSPDKVLSLRAEDIDSWLARDFTPGRIELNVVGDFELEKTIPLVLATFGALPDRPAAGRDRLSDPVQSVDFPTPPQEKDYTYSSRIERALSLVIWKVPGPRGNEEQFRRFNLLADIVADRLREEVREKLGASYSPGAGAGGSRELEDFGFLMAQSTGKPGDTQALTDASRRIAAELAAKGATEDELTRAKTPMLADLEKSLRDNSYWLQSVLNGSTDDPHRLELARSRIDDVRSITLAEINELAKRYLTQDNTITVTILPEP
ncbi:M16 family metallopeptidase [Haloferula sargassicola]|uniref:Zinc protease n=1 Tax=Haloferula sargassicola TaxID=490096 RepID=A0ABP9UQA7_9BACT